MNSVAHKPFVQIACICEKALLEADGVPSLIRIVDTFTLTHPTHPPAGLSVEAMLPLTIFISLKSGQVKGEHTIGLRINQPDGNAGPLRQWKIDFMGGEHGANARIEFALTAPMSGLYWFDVLWGEEVLTRMPLRLNIREEESTDAKDAPTQTVTHQ